MLHNQVMSKPIPAPAKTKVCKICNKRKRIKFFNVQVKKFTNSKGVSVERTIVFSYCIKCHSKKNKANQDKRRDQIREYNRKYQKSHPLDEESKKKHIDAVKRYRKKNRETIREKERLYRQRKREEANRLKASPTSD